MKLSELIDQEPMLRAKAKLASKAKARAYLALAYEACKKAGITNAIVSFEEESDPGDFYGLEVTVISPAEGLSYAETEQRFCECFDVREFADWLTAVGYGEFFSLQILVGAFLQQTIADLDADLMASSVIIDR